MKRLLLLLSIAMLEVLCVATLQATVTYKLSYNNITQVYTVSFNSTVAYSAPLSRISASTQFTIVAPDPDGTGPGFFAVTNLTPLTALNFGVNQLNSPALNTSKDYLFFAPADAPTYTPFNIPANTDIDLFTFKTSSPCSGTLYLYDNVTDPLNANVNINADNNIKVLIAGNVNLYSGNSSGPVSCPPCLLSNITAITTNVSCSGGANGAGTIVAADGTPPYTYIWPAGAGNQTTQTVTNLAAGAYIVTVSDAGNCTGTVTATISEPMPLTASASVLTPVSCNGGSNGSVSVVSGGGTAPHTYLWSNGSADQTATGLTFGTYTITVTDANGCTKTASATVTQPAPLSASISVFNNVSCNGGSNGSATVAVSGGTTAYSYLWSNGQTSSTATGLSAGSYMVTVTDAKGCVSSTTAVITAPAVLTAAISSQTNVLCFGAATGSATITVSGGSPAYSFLWPVAAGSQTTDAATGLSAGVYIATVTDGNGCAATVTATITQPAAALSVAISSVNVSCGGTGNGSATAAPTGGMAGYSYLWSSGATTATANNLAVGTHSVTVTDQNGCMAISNVVIGQNSGSVTYKLTLDPDGQTYRVSFNSSIAYNGPMARITGSTQFTLVFPDTDGAGPGAVQVTNFTSLTDLNMAFTQLNAPIQSPSKDYLFFASTNSGTYTLFNIPANTDIDLFTFKIAGGCSGSVSLFDNYADPLNLNPNISADNNFKTLGGGNTNLYCNNSTGPVACPGCILSNVTAITTDVSCFGGDDGATTVVAADGVPVYSYAWPASAGSQTTQTVTNLVAGTYTVTVTDGLGCTGTVTFTIAEPPVLTAAASVVAQVLCYGASTGSVMVVPGGGTPGYSILWTGGSTDQAVAGLAAGTYSVTVTDSKSCSVITSATVLQPAQALNATITASANASCAGGANGSATVTAGGGTATYTYLWSDGQTGAWATGLAAGTYQVTVKDVNNCIATAAVVINQPTSLNAVISAQTNVLCNGQSTGAATVTASGGNPAYSYLWPASAGSQTTATGINLAAGNYVVTITDANSCIATITVTITQPASALSVTTTGVNVGCGGTGNGSATATPAGGTPVYSYLWSNGGATATVNNLTVGTYIVTVTDLNGCTATSNVVIGQNSGSVTYKLTLDPDGQTYRVSFNSSIAYNGPMARITGSTQFTLVFPDPDGAGPGAVQLANVTSLTALDMDYTQLNNPPENPGADYLFFAATNAGSYTLFNIPANTDIDLFTFKIPAGCTGSISLFDNYADPLNADLNIGADNSFKTLGGGNTNLYCNNSSGPLPCPNCLLSNITAVTTDVTCFGGSNGAATIVAADGVPQYSYLWPASAGNQTTQTVTNLIAGTYVVTVTDGVGCTGTVTFTITQPPVLAATASVVSQVLCNGASTGSVTVSISGGSPNYAILWTGGSTDQTVTGLAAGTYGVTVTDSKGCSVIAAVIIAQPAQALSATITANTNASCAGGTNGTATVTAGGGGTSPYSYLWSNGQTTVAATGLAAGTYTVTVKDANNCTATTSVEVHQPTVLNAAISAKTDVLCNGQNTGSATITASGGAPAYSFLWPISAGSQATATATGLAAGAYLVTVTDANACMTTVLVTITQPVSGLSVLVSGVNVACGATSNGSATATPNGGTPGYTYMWSTGATTATATNLAVGTYTVTITDQNGCTAMSSVVIGQNTGTINYKLTLDPDGETYRVSFTSTTAYSGPLARITGSTQFTLVIPDPDGSGPGAVQVTNVTSLTDLDMDYTQLNNPPENPASDYLFFAPTNAGSYILFDIPANMDIDLFTFKIPAGCTGSISLFDNYADPLNADPNVGADNNFKTLGGGNTNLYCNNATGPVACPACELSNITAVTTDVTCFGGSNGAATIVAADGVPQYSYLWPASAGNQTTQAVTNLIAGTYVVTVTDGVGCTGTVTFTITQPPVLAVTASVVSQVLCNGASTGSVTVSISGGSPNYAILWTGGSTDQTVTGLAAGTYGVTVTDSKGCSVIASVIIAQPAQALTATITANTNASCAGGANGTATVTAGGGTAPYTYLWSNGQTVASATGLAAGTYDVTVKDANNCTATATVSIAQPTALTASVSAQTNVLCYGAGTGSATIVASGGSPNYSYLWPVSAGSQTTATANGLAAGAYLVTVTDANSCMTTVLATLTEPVSGLTVLVAGVNVACGATSNGSATATPNGGTPGYTYLWSNGATTATANNLTVGTYSVTVTDQNGCVAMSSVVIGQNTGTINYKLTLDPDGETYRVSFTSTTAYNGPLARITGSTQFTLVFPDPDGSGPGAVQVTNVTSLTSLDMGFTQLNNPAENPASDYLFFAPTNAGAYTLFDIPANTDIDLFTFKIPGGCTGNISLFDNYADLLNTNPNVSADNSFKTLGGGNTNLYCTNATGPVACPSCELSNITAVTTDVTCFGSANGTATIVAADGVPQYSYLWPASAGNQTTQTVINLIAGTYVVTVTDGVGCTGTVTLTINQPPALTASAAQTKAVSCFGGTNGSATATPLGGTLPYTYLWDNGSSDQTATGLSAGSHSVTVTDANGCTAIATVTITEPASAVTVTAVKTNVSCFGGSDGTATATGLGGTGTITYVWSNTQTGATATGLTAGTYDVTATDGNGCTAVASVVITETAQLTANIGAQNNVLCNGVSTGSATVTGAGGTTAYTYLWSASAAGQTTATASNLAAGVHSVTITDAKGCTAVATVTITQPTLLIAEIVGQTNIGCNGATSGTATVNATGGTTAYTYLWPVTAGSQTTATATNLAAGTYIVTVTDVNNCMATASVTIIQATNLTASAAQTKAVSCFGGTNGSATATPLGGTLPYTYLWDNGSSDQTATGLSAGSHSVTVTDANGCTATATVTITEPTSAVTVTAVKTNVSCFGGSDGTATATGLGGTGTITYVWSNTQTGATATGLTAGTYDVTATDGNGCTAVASVVITETAQLTANISAQNNVLCNGVSTGSATVTGAGGTTAYTYLWSASAAGQTTATASNLAAGVHSVTITDANGCKAVATVTITQPTLLIAEIVGQTNIGCNGATSGTATVNATGGTTAYTYLWPVTAGSQTTATAINLAAGTYIVTVTDVNNCMATASVTIIQATNLTASAAQTKAVSCFGGTNGSATATPLGGTLPYTYLWDNGSSDQTATGLNVGSHSVTVTDANGCTATATVTISGPATALTATASGTNVLCFAGNTGTANVVAAGGTSTYTYLWNTGATTTSLSNLSAGTYEVTATDANGCTAVDQVVITEPAEMTASVTAQTNLMCNGAATGSATIGVSGGTMPYVYLWSNSQTTATASGLTAGTYFVTITDAFLCTITRTVTITQPTLLIAEIVGQTNIGCNGATSGTATVNATGGTTAYTYLWPVTAGSQTTATATNLAAGTYIVTVTDVNNCMATASVTIIQATNLTASAAQTKAVSCFGGTNGSATATPLGGTLPYTYLWDNGSSDQTATGLSVGSHSVTVTDANGCTATATVTITEPTSAVTVTAVKTNVSCFGGSDGTATATGLGGTGTITYVWSNTQTGATATGLTAGTYDVTATDGNGCTAVASVVITETAQLTASITAQINVLCNGASTGSTTVTGAGGTTAYTYLWSASAAAQTTATASNLAAGVHSVTITDAKGCTAVATVTITQPTLLIAEIVGQTNIGCNGATSGTATVNATGGTTAYTYLWPVTAGSQTTATATNLAAGTYIVTVTDVNNCMATASVTIIQATNLTASAAQTKAVSCFGGTNGSATATPLGGTLPYTYLWDNGSSDQTATGLNAGSHSVTVTDANGCTATATVTISGPASALTATASGTNVLCFAGNTGMASVVATGGTSSYTYLWNTGATTTSLSNLTAGTYEVTVTDANGCTAVDQVVITEPAEMTASINAQTNVLCNGAATGSATIGVSGGTMPYVYLWSNSQTTATASGLTAGTYFVTITDASLCTITRTVTITQPTLLIAEIVGQTNIGCNGATSGTATANATGGTTAYTYLWPVTAGSQTTATATNLAAGTYIVTVTDVNNCMATASVTIIQATNLTASAAQTKAVSCFGGTNGSATATPLGGTLPYTYLWDNGSSDQTATGLSAGSHSVTVTDANGCTAIATVTISGPASTLTATASGTNVLCFAGNTGTASVVATGGTSTYTYLWNTGATTTSLSNQTAGTYEVTVTDANGCTAVDQVVITEPAEMTASITAQTNVLCNGAATGSATIGVSGGTMPYVYLWSNSQTTATASGLTAGTYFVTITDASLCTITRTVTITQPTLLIAEIVGQTNIGCNGATSGTATVNATGGTTAYTYLWPVTAGSQTTATATNLAAGTYIVTVTDVNNCMATASVTIIQATNLTASAAQTKAVSCFGGSNGSATATPLGGTLPYTYLWDNGSSDQTATGLNAGSHSVTVTDANGCTATATVTITEPTSAVTVTAVKTNVSCFGGSDGTATATGLGGTGTITYVWSNTQTGATATGLTAGTYDVTATDGNGCTAVASVVITETAQLTANISIQTNVLCNGASTGSATVTGAGGTTAYTYLWSASAAAQTTATASNLAAGVHNVTIMDAKGCMAVATVTITQPTLLIAEIVGQTNIGCNGATSGTATVNATGGTTAYTYLWPVTAGSQTTATATNLAAGTYIVTVTDVNNCMATASVTIIQATNLTASAAQTKAVSCFGGSNGSATATPLGGTLPYTYLWDNGSSDQTATGLSAGSHSVTVTDANGCTAIATVTITEPTSAVTVTAVKTNVSCFGGSDGTATATGLGGTGTITYVWSNTQTGATATGLTAGTYDVTATDGNGCTAVASVVITETAQLTASITAQTNVLCSGASTGSATVTGAGGTTAYTYLWSASAGAQTTATASNLAAGVHSVTITDAKGCTAVATVTITQPTLLIAEIVGQTNIGCNGATSGTATVNATGGTTAYTYLWPVTAGSQTTATATNLAAGTYIVTVTDVNNCMATASVTIIQATNLTASAAQTKAVSCFGGTNGSATATPLGGTLPYTYLWDNGSSDQTATGLNAGSHSVTVTDANGCTAIATVTITEPTSAVTVTAVKTNVSCFGGSDGTATATGLGGTGTFTYVWSNTQTGATATGLTTGTYDVTATDGNGCTAVASVVITETAQLTASITAQTNVLCNGASTGSATVTGAGGTTAYTYLWSASAGAQTTATASNLAAGVHNVTIMDAKGCTAVATVTITQPTLLIAEIVGQTNIGCNGATSGTATVNATGGTTAYTYLWPVTAGSQTTATATNLAAGTYIVTVTDVNNCMATATVVISVNDTEAPNAVCQDITVFLDNGGNANVTANQLDGGSTDNCGGITTTITGGTFTCVNVGDNNITLTVEDESENTATCVATVTVVDNIAPTFTCPAPITVSSCSSIIPDVVAGITNEADNCSVASIVQTPAAGVAFGTTTTITVTVTDVNGNSTSCDVSITRSDIQAPVFVNCPVETITISSDPGQCSALLNWPIPVATDDCGIQSILQTGGSLLGTVANASCPATTQTITYSATDVNNNASVCQFQVSVTDREKPEYDADIVMPADLTVSCNAVPAPFVLTNNDVNDNCTPAANLTIAYSQESTQTGIPDLCSNYNYTLTRTWTVTDCSGNMLIHTQLVTVNNAQAPTTVCQNITVTLDKTGTASITPGQINGGSSDPCAPGQALSLTASQTLFDCSDVGENTVTLNVNNPCGNNSSCTAIVTVLEGPGSCNPLYDVEGSDPCSCLNNATTLDNGQFNELIQVKALAGQNWMVLSSTGFYQSASGLPPVAPIPVVNGSVLMNGLSDNLDNDSDGMLNEADEAIYYTFMARHVDAIGYTVTLSNGVDQLTMSNKCYYPTPVFNNLNDPFCIGTEPFEISVGEINGAVGEVTSITVDGVETNTFDATTLGEGLHAITAVFDAGSPQAYTIVNGVVVNGSAAAAISDPGCLQKITKVVQIVGTPTTVVCNDTVHVSLGPDCMFTIMPDDVLEGTYGCFDDYAVQLDVTLPFGNGPWVPAQVDADDIGRYYTYQLIHAESGNVCSGVVLIEDKVAPTVNCPSDITIACSESTDVSHTGNVTATDCDTYTVVVDDAYTSFGQCTDPRAEIIRTFIVTDASGNQNTCSQTIIIAPFDLTDVVFPVDVTVNCENTYLNANATAPVSTGAPSINGASIVGSALCGAQVSKTDEYFDGCGGTYTILREWKVLNNCAPLSNDPAAPNPVTYVQRIQVVDLGGPVFACPGDFTVSVDGGNNCCATAPLPSMIITEGCSGILNLKAKVTGFDPVTGNIITFTVNGTLSDFEGNNYWAADTLAVFGTTHCLPRGTFLVLYTAEDQCGNLSSCSFNLTVEDLVPPVVTCTEFTTVAIGLDDPFDCYAPGSECESAGVTWVPAAAFNQGSYDNCNGVDFTIRRMQESDATYSSCIDSLQGLCDGYEYNLATAEYDSIKFYCCEVGTTQRVILRVYQTDLEGNWMTYPDGEFIYNECMIEVQIQDKIKPACQPPLNVTVSCENFDPSLWAYGYPTVSDNCCLDETPPTSADPQGETGIPDGTSAIPAVCGATQKVYYNNFPGANFDTTCNRGTIIRRFTAWDCVGQSNSCTQRIVVEYKQDYNITFPADLTVNCVTTPDIGKPAITNDEGCELIGISYDDVIFTLVQDACYKIERTWTVINWCTYDPDAPCYDLPRDPVNVSGLAPAKNWHVWDGDNPTLFPDNCVVYKQIIKVLDQTPPTVTCSNIDTCDVSANEIRFWNDGENWWDNGTQQHDLCEKETEITVTAEDLCDTIAPEGGLRFRYLLFLDLNNDGIMETVVSSADAITRPVGQVLYNNYQSVNYSVGDNWVFDNNPNLNQRYRFDIEQNANGARVIWRNNSGPKLPDLPHGRHKIKWIAEDGCGNEAFCEKTFEIRDCKPPVVACANVNINLMVGGIATLWANDFFLYGEDNCTPVEILEPTLAIIRAEENPDNTYPGGAPEHQSIILTCADEGTDVPVQVWLMDAAGNYEFCLAYINVQANVVGCTQGTQAAVAGVLATETQQGVEEAAVELATVSPSGQQNLLIQQSNDAGIFVFPDAVPANSDYTLTPTKDDNPLNGVTTYDLVLISKHILGLEPLTTPYRIIAADANRSGSITTFDIVEFRKLILGIYNELPNNTSWRFVDKAYIFPEPSNPFQTQFPENISAQDVQADRLTENFVGVKIGDVNNTVIANSFQSLEDRTAATMLFDVEDRVVKSGEVFTLHFKGAERVQGYQFTMNFNGLDVMDVVPGTDMKLDNFGVFADAITTSVDGEANEFAVTFRSTKAGRISQMLGISSRITKAEAYAIHAGGMDHMDIAFRFHSPAASGEVAIKGVGFELYQNQPNPFANKTFIGFHLPQGTQATLRIFDETGRMVYTQSGDFAKGYNTFVIDRQLVASTGVFYYTVETITDSATKRMIQSN